MFPGQGQGSGVHVHWHWPPGQTEQPPDPVRGSVPQAQGLHERAGTMPLRPHKRRNRVSANCEKLTTSLASSKLKQLFFKPFQEVYKRPSQEFFIIRASVTSRINRDNFLGPSCEAP